MTESNQTAGFKIQAEPIESHYGIPPKPGAIMFLESDNQLIYGDGYNWLDIGPGADAKAAIALLVETPFVVPFVAGVEKQVPFFDTEIYNYRNKFHVDGDELTITDSFDVDFYAEYHLKCDTPDVVVTMEQRYNGWSESKTVDLHTKGAEISGQSFAIFTAQPAKKWTVWAKASKDCNVTVCCVKIGFHERT